MDSARYIKDNVITPPPPTAAAAAANKVQVKLTLSQAMKSQKGNSVIVLLFL